MMKRKLFLFLVLLISCSLPAFCQQHWYASTAPNGRDINSVKILNPDTILLAGGWHIVSSFQTVKTPALFKTMTSGLGLWNVTNIVGTNDDWLKSIDFTDAQNGIAVGWNGQILTTSDKGDNWTQVNSPVNRDFNKIFFINSQQMIIVGGKQADTSSIAIQTILRTINGGQTWYPVIDQPGIWLKSVYFPTATLGYAVGDSGTILKSTNAGSSWTPVAAPIQRDFNAIWFADANNGFIVGGNLKNDSIRTILQTTNGGNTWTINKDELGGWLNDVHFLDADTGYAVGDRATVLKTIDGGQTWAQIIIPGTVGDEYFSTVRFSNWDFGFIAGRWGVQYTYNHVPAPEAYTSGTDVFDTTQITLNGFVNSHGFSSVYSYRFSPDNFTNLQFETPYPGYIKSNIYTAAPYDIPNAWLTPNTTYQYLIKAWTLGGTAYGDTLSFSTSNSNAQLTTLPASAIMNTSATMNGTVNGFSLPVNLFFEYGLTPSVGTQVAATPSSVNDTLQHSVTANLNSLQHSTLYFVRIKGESASGNYYGNTISFFTGTVFTTLQTLPATSVTDSSATLNGVVEGFKIPVSLSFDYSADYPNLDLQAPANPGNINDSLNHPVNVSLVSLIPGKIYYCRLRATTSSGTYFGDTVAFYTSMPALKTLTATDVTQSSARLNGIVSGFGIPVSLSFQYDTDSLSFNNEIFATPITVNDTTTHDVAATVSGLQNNTLYYYRLKAETSSGAKFYGNVNQLYIGSSSIPNWDFQYWKNETTPLLNQWIAVSDYIDRVPGHSGNYALEVFNQNLVMLGQVNFGGSPFQFSGGVPFTDRPDSVSAWFKYDFPPNDTAGLLIGLTSQRTTMVAQTLCKVGGSTGGVFKRIAFKIDYVSSLTPDSLVIVVLIAGSRDTMAIDDISFTPSAAALPNSDFETWSDYYHQRLQGWEYLQILTSDSVQNNRLSMVSRAYFDQASDDYAAEIKNNYLDRPGDYGKGSISTSLGILGSPPASFPVYARHLSLNGWFKYFPVNGDTMKIEIRMMKGSTLQVGGGSFYYSDSATQFQSFNLPITYYSTLVPDSGIIEISCSNNINHGPSRMVIDKLSFDGIVSDVKEINFPQHSVSGLTIFPNPTHSSITVQLLNGRDGNIEMYDLNGKLMLSKEFTGNKLELDVSDFTKGLYLIKILSGGKTINSKFILLK